jgi:predicted metal-dependent HD superfamily phosphohydrolase
MDSLHRAAPLGSKTPLRDALLRERFLTLWQRCLMPGVSSDAEQVWTELDERYSESHRSYHNKEHLAHCLEQLDLGAEAMQDPTQVELAIWFHDVINDPGARDNEARSVEFFRQHAGGLVGDDVIDAVSDLIMATTHSERPDDLDHQFICDIDLASFGCPWECFIKDSENVKAEFEGPDEDYYRRKEKFLEALLARPRIFMTDFFNARYEQQARENIAGLLRLVNRRRELDRR